LFENAGNKALSAFPPGLSIGANFEQVDGSGTPADCTADFSLAAGQECNLSISFKPKISNPISSKAVFTDNALNAPSSARPPGAHHSVANFHLKETPQKHRGGLVRGPRAITIPRVDYGMIDYGPKRVLMFPREHHKYLLPGR
jgi:hypothetical protein